MQQQHQPRLTLLIAADQPEGELPTDVHILLCCFVDAASHMASPAGQRVLLQQTLATDCAGSQALRQHAWVADAVRRSLLAVSNAMHTGMPCLLSATVACLNIKLGVVLQL